MASERTCRACGGTNMAVGIASTLRGDPIHPWYCQDCGDVTTLYASKADAAVHGPLKRVFTKSERKLADGRIDADDLSHMIPCEVCGEQSTTELHHWAPRHLFGEEAERWPQSHLCRVCHLRWHLTVTPNMSKRKAA